MELATEQEFRDRFPDCETGSMPPFGNLYGMDVFADESLADDKEISFNAGTHRELVRMRFDDFERLVKPFVIPHRSAPSCRARCLSGLRLPSGIRRGRLGAGRLWRRLQNCCA